MIKGFTMFLEVIIILELLGFIFKKMRRIADGDEVLGKKEKIKSVCLGTQEWNQRIAYEFRGEVFLSYMFILILCIWLFHDLQQPWITIYLPLLAITIEVLIINVVYHRYTLWKLKICKSRLSWKNVCYALLCLISLGLNVACLHIKDLRIFTGFYVALILLLAIGWYSNKIVPKGTKVVTFDVVQEDDGKHTVTVNSGVYVELKDTKKILVNLSENNLFLLQDGCVLITSINTSTWSIAYPDVYLKENVKCIRVCYNDKTTQQCLYSMDNGWILLE